MDGMFRGRKWQWLEAITLSKLCRVYIKNLYTAR